MAEIKKKCRITTFWPATLMERERQEILVLIRINLILILKKWGDRLHMLL
jgi:hypothetical protein